MPDPIDLGAEKDRRHAEKPHRAADLVCLDCRHRWIGVFEAKFPVMAMICPKCDAVGSVIVADSL